MPKSARFVTKIDTLSGKPQPGGAQVQEIEAAGLGRFMNAPRLAAGSVKGRIFSNSDQVGSERADRHGVPPVGTGRRQPKIKVGRVHR